MLQQTLECPLHVTSNSSIHFQLFPWCPCYYTVNIHTQFRSGAYSNSEINSCMKMVLSEGCDGYLQLIRESKPTENPQISINRSLHTTPLAGNQAAVQTGEDCSEMAHLSNSLCDPYGCTMILQKLKPEGHNRYRCLRDFFRINIENKPIPQSKHLSNSETGNEKDYTGWSFEASV
jgi:hypothetical protein